MSETDFFRVHGKQQIVRNIEALELETSAEVVVAVRRRSGDYRVITYHFGFICVGAIVLYLLLTPQVYGEGAIALDGIVAFALGVIACSYFEPLTRFLIRKRTLRQQAATAARVAFYDLGLTRTRGRNGILVFVSMFERTCVVLPDIGVDIHALGSPYTEICNALQVAIERIQLAAFLQALEGLGPLLRKTMPRAAADINELPDEVC